MTRFAWAPLAAALAIASAADATAQSPEEWRAAGPSQDGLVLEQSYTGTRPGLGNALPRVAELGAKPGNWVTWPGFLMREDGGSRLFLQTTAPLQYTRTDSKLRFSLRFENAKVHLSNNRNPLVTTFFNAPVKRAWLKRRGRNVDLVVELKVACQAAVTQYKDADGYHYLFVDFPPGDYPRSRGTSEAPAASSEAGGIGGSWGQSGGGGYYSQASTPGDAAPARAPAPGPAEAIPAEDIDLDYGTNAPPDPEPPPEE